MTTVQCVTSNDILDLEMASQLDKFNKSMNVRLDNSKFVIVGGEDFSFGDDDSDLPQLNLAYDDKKPMDEEYCTMAGKVFLPDSDDL